MVGAVVIDFWALPLIGGVLIGIGLGAGYLAAELNGGKHLRVRDWAGRLVVGVLAGVGLAGSLLIGTGLVLVLVGLVASLVS